MYDDPVTVAKLILEVTRAVDNGAVSTEMGDANA
jgi:hypothetical protein